jgi:hypothetical protein
VSELVIVEFDSGVSVRLTRADADAVEVDAFLYGNTYIAIVDGTVEPPIGHRIDPRDVTPEIVGR